MPIESCYRKGEKGYRYGRRGFCYLPSEEGSDEAAREKAEKQGQAIEISRHKSLTINIKLQRYETRNKHPFNLSE